MPVLFSAAALLSVHSEVVGVVALRQPRRRPAGGQGRCAASATFSNNFEMHPFALLRAFAPSRLRVRTLQRSRYAPKLNVCSPPVRQEAKHKGTHRIEAIPPSRFDKPGTHSSPHSTRFVPTTHLHPSGIVPTASEEVDLTAERQAMSYQ